MKRIRSNRLRDVERPSRKFIVAVAYVALALGYVMQISADDSAAVATGATAPAAAVVVPAPPLASLITTHAERGLLLSIVNTGQHLVAVGGNGDIVISDDGKHWKQVPTPVDVTLTGVAFADAQHGWAVGHDALILHTFDGGNSWAIQNFQPDLNAPMFAVLAIDAQKALAVGAFGTLKMTEDGGAHWMDIDAPTVQQGKLHLNAVTRLASGELFIAGEHGLAAVSQEGHQWQSLTLPYDGSFFGALPWGAHGAIVYGLRGTVFVTNDIHAGQWQKIDTQTTSSFFAGLALPQDRVALAGGDGSVVLVDQAGTARALLNNSGHGGQASSFAGGIAYKDQLLLVGDSGVEQLSMK